MVMLDECPNLKTTSAFCWAFDVKYLGQLELFRGDLSDLYVNAEQLQFQRFASLRAGSFLCPAGAKGYYELTVLSDLKAPQFGFCSPAWAAVNGFSSDGVGDDKESWGVDGCRVRKWHGGDAGVFGRIWRSGDVIGFACKLPAPNAAGSQRGQMLVSVNGDFSPPNGRAFELPPGLAGLHAAFSCQSGVVRCNLGGYCSRPLLHAPPSPEYRPMGAFLLEVPVTASMYNNGMKPSGSERKG